MVEVRQARQIWQDTMKEHFVETIERLTGGRVVAFMSANHQDPDLAVEMFVSIPSTRRRTREAGDRGAGEPCRPRRGAPRDRPARRAPRRCEAPRATPGTMTRRDPRPRPRLRLRARDERRLSAQAARRGLGAVGACQAPAAKRRRPLPLQVVRAGLGGGGRRLGASRRRPRARAAVGRAGRARGRAGLPGRARRALLRLRPRTSPVDRRDHHDDRACDHRAHPGAAR